MEGMSLFQGTESIQVSNDQQRAEEEDAIEDQRRRNEELGNELKNAFDDLDDTEDENEDASIMTDVSASEHQKKIALPNHVFQFNGVQNDAELRTEIQQLKNALASRNQELTNLNAQFKCKCQSLETQIEELNKRLTISEAERERAHMNRQQTQELFVESKQKLLERDGMIKDLNAKIKASDTRYLDAVGELERTKSLLNEVQHKYHMVEKNANYSSDKHNDSMIKHLNDRHAAQTDMMQQQINTLSSRLEERDCENKRLVVQNTELHKSREAMMLNNNDTITEMTQRINDAQRQYQDLMRKSGSTDEIMQENSRLIRQIQEMKEKINELNMQLESQNMELEQLTVTAIHDNDVISSGENQQDRDGINETPMIRRAISQPRLPLSSSTPMMQSFKQEFTRCVADQKAKRQEIRMLKEELAQKNQEIIRLKTDENHALIELTMNKENTERLEIRLKNAERELNEYKNQTPCNRVSISSEDDRLQALEKDNENFRVNCNHLNETIRALEDERDSIEAKYREACKEIAELQQELTQIQSQPCMDCEKEKFLSSDAQQECTRLKEMCLQLNNEKDETARKLKQAEAIDANKELLEQRNKIVSLERSLQLAEMKYNEKAKILEREKDDHETFVQNLRSKYEEEISKIEAKEQKDLSNACQRCGDLMTKTAKLEVENLKLQTANASYLKEIHELKQSTKKAEQTVSDLSGKLALKEEHDQLLNELKEKAQQFEEFMRNQSPTKSLLVDIVGSQTRPVRDQCVSTDDSFNAESPRGESAHNTSADGKRIREEMSRTMASKMKSIEQLFKEKSLEYEKRIGEQAAEVNSLQLKLHAYEGDISKLKMCIVMERAKWKEQSDEHNEVTKQLEHRLSSTSKDHDIAKKRIEILTHDMAEYRKQFHEERESMKKLMSQWKTELNATAQREKALIEKMQALEKDHKDTVDRLNEKLSTTLNTAVNYKKYADDKENHIRQESERMAIAYKTEIEQVKDNMKAAMKDYENQANRRIAEMQNKLDTLTQKRK